MDPTSLTITIVGVALIGACSVGWREWLKFKTKMKELDASSEHAKRLADMHDELVGAAKEPPISNHKLCGPKFRRLNVPEDLPTRLMRCVKHSSSTSRQTPPI